ncbi:competence type IV pilus ATPase ComGA [Alteribacter populi]|uniref:competence type IV pilus ATPase ComGA n=1 Tax=Alteribacter populi TaxID=2011011 RepID=UPI000BBA93A5|nr:competence type IV pilus ATPase ComGA [Alteribacter populi]
MDVEQHAKRVLNDAAQNRASDIHILPQRSKGVIRYRIDGELVDAKVTSTAMLQKLIAHLKFLSGMDIGERRRPQNSSLEIMIQNQPYALRLSTFPMTYSETLVIRLLHQGKIPSIFELALFKSQARKMVQLSYASYGLILICGPTGSGKTTTLYSLMNESLQTEKRNIISLEDPVEQQHDEFLQMEVNEKAGVTYANGLKNVLRHDPDVIMIGEIRDEETAQMAVRAAMTGHLVLSTLHSSTPTMAIRRLAEFGLSSSDIQETLLAVSSQSLLKLACPLCGKECNYLCYRQRRRAAIFDILTGPALTTYMTEKKSPNSMQSQLMKKAFALGYLSDCEKERWVRRTYV